MGSLIHLVFFLLIGLAAGWLAGRITKGKSDGLVNDLIVGVVGAFLGGVLFSLIGLSASNLIGSLITATVGAIVFLYLLRPSESDTDRPWNCRELLVRRNRDDCETV